MQGTIVKLMADKLQPQDQLQVLALLKNIKDYLKRGDMMVSQVRYDEPLITVEKLVASIDDYILSKPQPSIIKGKKSLTAQQSTSRVKSASTPVRLVYLRDMFHHSMMHLGKSTGHTCFSPGKTQSAKIAGKGTSVVLSQGYDNDDYTATYSFCSQGGVEEEIIYQVFHHFRTAMGLSHKIRCL